MFTCACVYWPLTLWSDFPFLSDVGFKEWLVVLGGLKRAHNLVQSLSTAGNNKLAISSLGHRVDFVWKAEMKTGRGQKTEDIWRTNVVMVGESS